jgi:aryl-alcohol dehydrogenase-like predicted oxidoreductase
LALAWLLHRSPQTVLIPGTTSIAHLEENMGATEITLDDQAMAAIAEAASAARTWRPSTTE